MMIVSLRNISAGFAHRRDSFFYHAKWVSICPIKDGYVERPASRSSNFGGKKET